MILKAHQSSSQMLCSNFLNKEYSRLQQHSLFRYTNNPNTNIHVNTAAEIPIAKSLIFVSVKNKNSIKSFFTYRVNKGFFLL